MDRLYTRWIVCYFLVFRCIICGLEEFCRFGDGPGCLFPCRCTSGCDKTTGECLEGGQCQLDDPPEAGIPRSGSACQIGNVAKGKPAVQEGTYGNLRAVYATDGYITSDVQYCAHPDSSDIPGSDNTWWYVDLQDIYKVVSVTVFNRDGYYHRRTGSFRLGVSNETDVHRAALCKQYTGTVPEAGKDTITCNRPVTGRYVSILRNGGFEPTSMALCEVMVHGYKPIDVDCGYWHCHDGCNDLTGCQVCSQGYKYPDCRSVCDRDFYGDCQQKCSDNCIRQDDNSTRYCGRITGSCLDGCLDGFRGYHCTQPCSEGCLSVTNKCLRYTGECVNGCEDSYYGLQCQNNCSSTCRTLTGSNTCHNDTGFCTFGCEDGYYGDDCTTRCNNRCLVVPGQPTCERGNGSCIQGCIAERHGNLCKKFCSDGCRFQPDTNTSTCSQTSGYCDDGCKDGLFGDRCKKPCSPHCQGENGAPLCDRDTGSCSTGCQDGYYGDTCQYDCSSHCELSDGALTCDRDTGECTHGCQLPHYDTWYDGERCDIEIVYLDFPSNHTIESENRTTHSITISWPQLSEIPQNLTQFFGYRIYISNGFVQGRRSRNHIDMKLGQSNARRTYVVTSLSPNTTYSVMVHLYRQSSKGQTEESRTSSEITVTTLAATATPGVNDSDAVEGDSTGLVTGSVIGVVVLAILVVLLIIFLFKKRRSKDSILTNDKKPVTHSVESALDNLSMDDMVEEAGGVSSHYDSPSPASKTALGGTAIARQDLEEYIHVKKYKADGLKKEFTDIPNGELKPCTISNRKENINKNRFKNIKPYDLTRVPLEPFEEEKQISDFINATYIRGYPATEKHYVATQGPKPHTIKDLWKMIWQLRSNRIVMVTRLNELGKQKCEQYWPESVGSKATYGPITVTTTSIDGYADYVITVIHLQKGNESRTIKHLQFLSWPDKQSPEHAFPLLAFRRKLRSFDKEGTGPIIVHCSAGVGRTGTFIALDCLLDQMHTEGKVDIIGIVTRLRFERMNMIQTFSQYVFLYEALSEAYQQGETTIPCNLYPERYTQLVEGHEYSNQTPIEEQFEVLSKLKYASVRPGEKSALIEPNIKKNRDIDITPENKHRLFLTTQCPGTTDYINAVTVNSLLSEKSFIVTQLPLSDTVIDFWRLLYEYKCHTVVTLQAPNDRDQDSPAFWPVSKDEELTFGPLQVKLSTLYDEVDTAMEVREFLISYTASAFHESPSVSVRHVLFTKWSSNQTLPDKEDLLDLIEYLQKSQQRNKGGKIVIQCRDGATRSGVLCAAYYLIEKMKADSVVDVFLAVRSTALHRHQFVSDLTQYRYLHDVAMDFISRNDLYGNFK